MPEQPSRGRRDEQRHREGVFPGLLHDPTRPWLGPHRPVLSAVARPVLEFFRIEATGGLALMLAAVAALVWANAAPGSYQAVWATQVGVHAGGLELAASARSWVDEGLLTFFFLVVGMEIKSEVAGGLLSTRRRAALPVAAAVGGMLVPALVYLAVNRGAAASGWGIPIATDIAFAVGVLTVMRSRIPRSLLILLLAIAIADDIGAALVIAVFYTTAVSLPWLGAAAALVAAVAGARRLQVWYLPVYLALGTALWVAAHEAGLHAAIVGVALGLLAPARALVPAGAAQELAGRELSGTPDAENVRRAAFVIREVAPVAGRMESALHPWTSYVVIPVFALANAGIVIDGPTIAAAARSPVTLGVMAGLVLGKPAGLIGGAWLAQRLRIGELPDHVHWRHVTALGFVAGIGFTMSLFITQLAFTGEETQRAAKAGVLAASALAALIAAAVVAYPAWRPGRRAARD